MLFNLFFYFLIFTHFSFRLTSLRFGFGFGFGFANAVGCSVPLTRLLSVCHLLCVACALFLPVTSHGAKVCHAAGGCWLLAAGCLCVDP